METSEQHQDERLQGEGVVPPGQRLRQAREARNLSVPEVASALRLSVSSVENLEQDRYDRLPPDTFVRGYLRSYASLVELPPEPLLAAFRQATGTPVPRPLRARKPVQTAPDLSLGMKRFLPVIVGLMVVVIAGAWGVEIYRDMGLSSAARESVLGPVEEAQRVVSEELAAREARPDTGGRSGGATAAPEAWERRLADADADPAPTPVPDAVSRPETQAAPAAAQVTWQPQVASRIEALDGSFGTIPEEEESAADDVVDDDNAAMAGEERESDGERLVLRFTGPSWVEVRDAEGERLLYELISEGGRRSLSGTPPYSLVIGDVGHVSVELDGEAVDLGDRRPGRVARLQIPR